MEIIAHRGFWKKKHDKNTFKAFNLALSNGFGIETDIRDLNREIVVSHDLTDPKCNNLEKLFEMYNKINAQTTLFLNVKSDGLQAVLLKLLNKYKIKKYFLFDMSVPDHIQSIKYKLKVYTRQSEYENKPVLLNESDGIWMDCFVGENWIKMPLIKKYILNKKRICFVSPELHGRKFDKFWRLIKTFKDYKNISICTDYPDYARRYFNEQ